MRSPKIPAVSATAWVISIVRTISLEASGCRVIDSEAFNAIYPSPKALPIAAIPTARAAPTYFATKIQVETEIDSI